MVTAAEIEQLLALGHEIRSFEVKGPGSLTDKAYCAKIARAAIAMGNLRDGGLICLGIDDTQVAAMQPGLGPPLLAEWSDFDNVSDMLRRYIDPPVEFSLHSLKLSTGVDVVVIKVEEFETVPHVCKRTYPGELQNGMTYVRPRGKPESVPVPTSSEMRELLDLAITKGVREFIRRAGAAGVQLGEVRSVEEVEREAFTNEAARSWADVSPVLERILGAGHLDVAIRPAPFDAERVSPSRLEPLVVDHAVRLRGWPLPYVDYKIPIVRHGSWIGQDIEPTVVPHCEAWRMCTSGQFLHRRMLATDLRDSDQFLPDAPGATGAVTVWDVLLYLVEVAELAARLATTLECGSVAIHVVLGGVAGRQLIAGDWNRELHAHYVVAADQLEASVTMSSAELIVNPRATGVSLTQQLLRQFGADVSDHVLLDWQGQLFGA